MIYFALPRRAFAAAMAFAFLHLAAPGLLSAQEISAAGQANAAMPADNTPPPAAADQQIATLKKQLADLYLQDAPKDADTQATLAKLQPDGSFSDLDYSQSATGGFPLAHLGRVHALAVAYSHPDSPEKGSADLKTKILSGLDYWFKLNPQGGSDWNTRIGIPLDLGPAMILMAQELSPQELQSGLAMLKAGNINGELMFAQNPATGENLTWIAKAQLIAGILTGDYNYTHRAAQILATNIKVARIVSKHTISEEEGIQPDMSFQEHGPDLQSGASYGKTFARDIIEIAWFTRGTDFAVSADKIDIIARYVLDGQQWMCRDGNWDFTVTGRAIGSNVNNISANLDAINTLAQLEPGRAIEAQAFARRVTGQDPPSANVPVGNRAFWCADYMSHSRPDYFAAVKMFSFRTVGTECGNGEGVKNYYLPTGAMCLMKTGLEYHNMYPLWNWRQVPGITCAQSDDPYPQNTFGRGGRGTTAFAGSVSDGTYGVAGFDLNRDGLAARKSWFFFDDEIVCLGAGITDAGGKPVYTTLNQCRLDGDITTDQGSAVPLGHQTDLSTSQWLLHAGVGYYFPQPQKVFAVGEKRTAPWKDIEAGNPNTATGWMFDAWIDHGASPQGATYAYIVIPKTDAASLAGYKDKAPQIISNTATIQAVWHAGLGILDAVFYQPGQVQLPSGETLTVDHPCIVMARKNGVAWQVSLSDPTQVQREVGVTFGRASLHFTLGTGENAGKTVTQPASGI